MPAPRTTRFQSTKAYDVLAASPLVFFYTLSIFGLAPQFKSALVLRPAWFSALQIAVLASDICYFSLVVALVFLRSMPVGKSRGLWPRLVALLGANLLIAVALLPKASLSVPMAALAAVLTGGGTLTEVAILFWLGRSFTVLPEARRLVTTGPYRFIRHPLYLVSFVASVGAMIQFQQPWAVMIVFAADMLQLARIHYEEQVLRESFPDYADYAARSWRLVPGIY